LPLALAFVVPPSLVHSRPRLIAAASPLIMEEGTKPEVVTRKQISEKMADSMQYGGQLSVYMLLRPKLESLFEAVAGGKDAVVSSEQLGTLMSSVGDSLSEEQIAGMMRDAGCGPGGGMNFAKWAKLMMEGDPAAKPPTKKGKGFFGLF